MPRMNNVQKLADYFCVKLSDLIEEKVTHTIEKTVTPWLISRFGLVLMLNLGILLKEIIMIEISLSYLIYYVVYQMNN